MSPRSEDFSTLEWVSSKMVSSAVLVDSLIITALATLVTIDLAVLSTIFSFFQ